MAPDLFSGPADLTPAGLTRLAPGVWLTRGRAALVEERAALVLIDPGDEPVRGVLEDVSAVVASTGKPLALVALTHAHPDHVANLDAVLAEGARVAAHANSPIPSDARICRRGQLDGFPTLLALPLTGHSPWGDDLAFFHRSSGILFSGDIVQPKGESWERAFYPSPYPYFTDGDAYAVSLAELLALPFTTLLTGHRELRTGAAGRGWVEVTLKAIREVERLVGEVPEGADFNRYAEEIFVSLCRARSIDEATIEKRMSPPGGSAFSRFDLPGIAYFWRKRFGDV